MLIDVKKLFDTYTEPVCVSVSADLSEDDFPGYSVPEPADVNVTLTMSGRLIELAIKVTAQIQFECARCLEECSRQFEVERTYTIREADFDDPDAELPFTPEGRLDVKELAYDELLLEIPTVLLCSDDCAGLCPVCGNRKPCSCRHETSDPVDERLSILKQLLKD